MSPPNSRWLFPPLDLTQVDLYESIKKEPFKIPLDDSDDLVFTFFNPDKEGWLLKQVLPGLTESPYCDEGRSEMVARGIQYTGTLLFNHVCAGHSLIVVMMIYYFQERENYG